MIHEIPPVLRDHLDAVFAQAPDPAKVIAAARLEIRTTPQQRAFMPRSTQRMTTMFSATKLFVAGATVALFGGFLLNGVLTQQPSDERLPPAAASPSASPEADASATTEPTTAPETSVRTDILSGVPLTVEAVEPGVFRVLDDGTGRIAQARLDAVEVGGAGSDVWIGMGGSLARLGHPDSIVAAGDSLRAAPDGSFWSLRSETTRRPKLYHIGGVDWTEVTEQPMPDVVQPEDPPDWSVVTAFDVTPDGRVWVAIPRDPEPPLVAVLEHDEWTVLPSTEKAWAAHATNRERREGHHCCDMVVEPTGVVWLADGEQVTRYNGKRWQSLKPFIVETGGFANWAVGDDGTLWSMGVCSGDALLRHDRRGWQTWNVIPWDGCAGYGTSPTVGPDGKLWLRFGAHVGGATHRLVRRGIIPKPDRDAPNCEGRGSALVSGASPGILSFDGKRWHQYLAGHCVSDMAVASDGSVWVTYDGLDASGRMDHDRAGLYVITPRP